MVFSGLKAIGLDETEIKVYQYLVERGEERAEWIARELNISSEEVKAALYELEAVGAVQLKGESVAPNSPKSFLQRYLKKQEVECDLKISELRAAVNRLQTELEPLYAEKRLGMRMEELLQVIDGLPAMELETVKILSRARSEICILAEQFSWYDKVREELLSARERGVWVRVLLLVGEGDAAKRIREMVQHGIEVRVSGCEWRSTRFTIVDSRELIFLIWARKSSNSRIYHRPSYTKNPGLVSVFHDSFEWIWEKSRPP
ncbi:MAG: helix-turn-helix domain-containing protein [Candidatus Verstraetearchaeota archaeon]|nr:helix-turn-helix domain-containing protein [Candidatus Verstraetearchaeota archaeon]